MPYYRFSEDDVFYNRMKTHPSCHFFVWQGSVYYNNKYTLSGAYNSVLGHVSGSGVGHGHSGYINLYELNVDRREDLHTFDTTTIKGNNWDLGTGVQTMIHPFLTKDGGKNALKSLSYDSYVEDFSQGDILPGSYPFSASITRMFFQEGSAQNGNVWNGSQYYYQAASKESETLKIQDPTNEGFEKIITDAPKLQKTYIQALENTINYYKKWSPHFSYSSSFDPLTGKDDQASKSWDKSYQDVNVIDVPSIFFGSAIKKGTVSLKYYITGTLIGELQDSKRNGELIQVCPSGSYYSGSVAGVILYNEGALILTGAWDLTSRDQFIGPEGSSNGHFGPGKEHDYLYHEGYKSPSWIYYGTGMNDNYPTDWDARRGGYIKEDGTVQAESSAGRSFISSSFELAFSGTNYIPTITMMAHAKRGYLNWSNNPTYMNFDQPSGSLSGSTYYKEGDQLTIKNTISSSFSCHTASFKKQTFIDKIGIYDKDRNLIAIAKVATPVRKLETDDYTFKLKLDI